MSFSNRSNYSSLQDAYGISNFEQNKEKSYCIADIKPVEKQPVEVKKTVVEEPEIKVVENSNVVETFGQVKKCSCNKQSRINIKDWINEILNIILITVLLWIIIFKPNI